MFTSAFSVVLVCDTFGLPCSVLDVVVLAVPSLFTFCSVVFGSPFPCASALLFDLCCCSWCSVCCAYVFRLFPFVFMLCSLSLRLLLCLYCCFVFVAMCLVFRIVAVGRDSLV